MWVRKRIDIGYGDLAAGAAGCAALWSRAAAERRLLESWSGEEDWLASLSVRSGLDLLLRCADWTPGDEVLLSALTIGDIVHIVRHHKLTPVPVDVAPDTMSPDLESLERAVSHRTRAIVVAHLFGARVPLEPIAPIARRHGLLLIEDCAQAFAGRGYAGHPLADASMFSFGPVKTATALGGALVRVREPSLRQRMRIVQDSYPVQSRLSYLLRLIKYAGIKLVTARVPLAVLMRVLTALGVSHDALAQRLAKGFSAQRLFRQIRRRPGAPLLAMLRRQIERFDGHRFTERTRRGAALAAKLAELGEVPAAAAECHSHWVMPILVDKPDRLIVRLRAAGFDAMRGGSMCAVPPPEDRPECRAVEAERLLGRLVILPFETAMPEETIERLVHVVQDVTKSIVPKPLPLPSYAAEEVPRPSYSTDALSATTASPSGVAFPSSIRSRSE